MARPAGGVRSPGVPTVREAQDRGDRVRQASVTVRNGSHEGRMTGRRVDHPGRVAPGMIATVVSAGIPCRPEAAKDPPAEAVTVPPVRRTVSLVVTRPMVAGLWAAAGPALGRVIGVRLRLYGGRALRLIGERIV